MKNIAIVCGGFSGEYEISVQSAEMVSKSLDKEKFNAFVIVIKKDDWFYTDETGNEHTIDKSDFSLYLNGGRIIFDGVFNAIHGSPGEDGKLLSYFDMLDISYTSCGADASALTFNKYYCNAFVRHYGIKMATQMSFVRGETIDKESIVENLGLPLFVKPVRSGSSVGISKVNKIEDLQPAIELAFEVDERILVEEFIKGREIACGMMQKGKEIIVLPLTEIISKKDFFDYEAKYTSTLADEICPAQNIPEDIENDIKGLSSFLWHQLDCKGFVRFDYILTESELYFLEVNSVPGISAASIIPKMTKEFGYSMEEFFGIITENMFL